MKNVRDVIGIDVSKKTIDATAYQSEHHAVFTNDRAGYSKLLKWANHQVGSDSYFLCFENTGNYSLKLSVFLSESGVCYVEESPMRIKRSTVLYLAANCSTTPLTLLNSVHGEPSQVIVV
ncbi:IS110 family transposase [Xanthomarina gelatinilytica]|uniref:IS110 family transposase n=1 Tax=Xanthomarina gelatinilytica TaxID=1137281 RepID=UPI003AA9D7EA